MLDLNHHHFNIYHVLGLITIPHSLFPTLTYTITPILFSLDFGIYYHSHTPHIWFLQGYGCFLYLLITISHLSPSI
ncbi:hypothetical protein RchiOBHm_Chr3g0472071 [Rosa chinensis]|uniref:Uncharacterized protein n=1 Tax=Rosa chinensis TaxID=74649 RepID=A0A2P6RBI5_ROSCH|nr:hypothetical protein RchiOBHm_Chr3g0472071 [Rosa chinensis]